MAPAALPPDWNEMNAQRVSSLAEKVQSRMHTPFHLSQTKVPSGPVACLPKGIPPEIHFEAGRCVDSPMSALPPVAEDMDFAIRKTVALGSRADAWRKRQLRVLRAWINNATELENFWSQFISENARMAAPGVRPHAIDLLAHSMRWPDKSLAAMAAAGASPIGRQETTGVFRPKQTLADLQGEVFETEGGNFMQELLAKKPPSDEQKNIVYKLSEEERNLGLLEGWYTAAELDAEFGKGQWRAMPRYAVWQAGSGKWRLIDNGRAGQQNATFEACETIHTTCTAAGVAAAARFRKHTGKALRGRDAIVASTQDMWKAYRQVPCHPRCNKFLLIMIWHPSMGKWVFGKARGLLFGLSGAVLAFNRIPAFITAVARRWLAIPVQSFFDDFRVLDVARAKGSANKYFGFLMEMLGWKLDEGKARGPASEILFLGNAENYKPAGGPNDVIIGPKEGRVEAIAETVKELLKGRKLTQGDAKTLRGRLLHLASTCAGRMGKGVLYHISQRAEGGNEEWSEGLEHNLVFVWQLLQLLKPRRIDLHMGTARGPRVWTDASYAIDDSGAPRCKICAIIATETLAKPEGIVLEVPREVLASFKARKQQIHMGELLGPFCAILQWPSLLKDHSTVFFIDNMGALCNIVNGSSRELDAGTLTFAMHLRLAQLNATCWWEWVASESNCSDGGSREGITCPMSRKLGITLVSKQFPVLPREFTQLKPHDWETFWEKPN